MPEKKAQDYLCSRIRIWYAAWVERLSEDQGLQAMVKVSEGFSYKEQRVQPYKLKQGGHRSWFTLAEALQTDEIERRRIQFYKEVSTQWMTAQGVNVLDMCELNEACLPARENRENGRTKILSYFKKNISVPRPCFPKAPSGFEWGSGKRSARFERKPATTRAATLFTNKRRPVCMKYVNRNVLSEF